VPVVKEVDAPAERARWQRTVLGIRGATDLANLVPWFRMATPEGVGQCGLAKSVRLRQMLFKVRTAELLRTAFTFLLHQIGDKQRPELIDAAGQRPVQHPCAKAYRHHDADLPGSVQRPHAARVSRQ